MAEENSKTPGRSSPVPKLQQWYPQHRKRRCIQGFSYFLSEFVLVDWDDNSVFKRQFFSSCQGRRENLAFDSGPATLASSENKNQELAVLAASPQPNHFRLRSILTTTETGRLEANLHHYLERILAQGKTLRGPVSVPWPKLELPGPTST